MTRLAKPTGSVENDPEPTYVLLGQRMQYDQLTIRRREFITLLGGAAATQ